MPTIHAEDIPDLVMGTLREMGRMKFQQIAQNLTEYEILSKWLKKDKLTFDSGIGIQRTLMMKLSGAAKHVGLFEKDVYNISDLLTQMNIGWAHAHTYWGFEYRETLMNRGKQLVVKVLEPRRAGAMIDLAEELEEKAWTLKATNDTKSPLGLPYWIVKNALQGFNGGNPTGYSNTGGIDRSLAENAKFCNWTDTYRSASKSDVIRKMRKAYRHTHFKSPVSVPDFRRGTGLRYRIYTDETTVSAFEELGESRNENLGRDLATMDDQMTFKRVAVHYVPYLDGDAQHPIYMINHQYFYPVGLKGDFLRESKPRISPQQHNTYIVDVDLSYNYLCVNPRSCAVLYQAA